MAPRAREPYHVLTILNTARRKALYTLLTEITRWMRSRIELKGTTNNPNPTPTPELVRLRSAALAHFDSWRRETLGKAKELLLNTPDDEQIVGERRKRAERAATSQAGGHGDGELISLGNGQNQTGEGTDTERAREVARLQEMYPPVPTRLVTIPYEDREETLSCVLLLLLSAGRYPPESRTLALGLASALGLPVGVLNREEYEIAALLVEESEELSQQGGHPRLSADAEAQKRKQENQASRFLKVGLASVAGAALIGVTGGLAAPVVAGAIGGLMGTVGLGGVASFLGIFLMNPALVGTLFGAFGARMTGEIVDQYAKEVEDFRFIPIKGTRKTSAQSAQFQDRRLRITIGINGWLDSKDDVIKPWRFMGDDSEVFALQYEMSSLVGLGASLRNLVTSSSWNFVKVEILKRTVLATLWSALWPAHLLSMAASIDNPFSLAKNRSEKAGKILADALINKVQGERPVTLVGYSLGARVIYSCLRSLVDRRAFGLVDSVVFIGAPVPSNRNHWMMMRSVVSGNMHNVHSENDYLLAFIYRATSVQLGVSGLQEIEDVDGVVNLDLSDRVHGHLRYPELIDQILAQCGFPMAEGAATGPIEQDDDEEEASLRHEDSRRAGSLIELEGLPASRTRTGPAELSADSPAQQKPAGPASHGKQRSAAVTVPTSVLSVADDPLSGPNSQLHPAGPSGPERRPRPEGRRSTTDPASDSTSREPHQSDTNLPPAEPANMKYLGTAQDLTLGRDPSPGLAGTEPARPPAYSLNRHMSSRINPVFSSSNSIPGPAGVGAAEPDEADSDEDSGFAIRMVDNDNDEADLTYQEPTPIED